MLIARGMAMGNPCSPSHFLVSFPLTSSSYGGPGQIQILWRVAMLSWPPVTPILGPSTCVPCKRIEHCTASGSLKRRQIGWVYVGNCSPLLFFVSMAYSQPTYSRFLLSMAMYSILAISESDSVPMILSSPRAKAAHDGLLGPAGGYHSSTQPFCLWSPP